MDEKVRKHLENIFSGHKVDAIERRLMGIYTDKDGSWSRVKPQIISLNEIIKNKTVIDKLMQTIKR